MKQKMFASQIQNGFLAQNLPVVPKVNDCMALKRCQIVAKLSRVPTAQLPKKQLWRWNI